MAKNKNKENEIATYIPEPQSYVPMSYMPPQAYNPAAQPYMPVTQPINPSISPQNPSLAVLGDESVIIAPKKPNKALRPITFKSLFWGIVLLLITTFIVFMIATYFFVDSWNPFRIIADFFTEFDFGKFFRELFIKS